MNFDKFKNLKPKRIEAPKDDFGYSNELLELKSRPTAKKIIPILSTVAAAVVIVTVVTLWALVGRGIRIGIHTPAPAPSDKPSDTVSALMKDASITTLQREQFFDMFVKYQINAMPEFSEGQMPDINDMAQYILHLNPDLLSTSMGVIPSDIFERDTSALFGFDYQTDGDTAYKSSTLCEYPFAELIDYEVEGEVVTATAAVYYMWNLVEQNCSELYPEDFAIAKSTVIEGGGNIVDITAIYTIKYLSDDGITPKKFLQMEKCVPPSDEYNAFFE